MKKSHRIIFAVAAPLAALICVLLRDVIMAVIPYLGHCAFHEMTGLLCPGCGNTRSLRALLHGDILLAVRNNISLPFISLTLLCFYIENAFGIFDKKICIVPRKWQFWCVIAFLFGIYFVVRNFIPAIAPV